MSELADFADIVPVSAVAGEQVELLTDLLIARLPDGRRLYPDAEITDEPLETRIAELVREAALDGVREELPHSLAALVTEIVPPEPRQSTGEARLTRVSSRSSSSGRRRRRSCWATRVLGWPTSGGGPGCRSSRCSGTRVYLDLHVAVAKDWQRDPKQLRKLGFDS